MHRMSGFTKLDRTILQSSIMLADGDTFKAWIALLAATDSDGIARISPVFLATICHISMDKCMEILDFFMQPDPYSRSKASDGRRIQVVEDGYYVINYLDYREHTYSTSRDAIKKRKKREQEREQNRLNKTDIGGTCPDVSVFCSSVSCSSVSGEEESERKGGNAEDVVDEIYALYPSTSTYERNGVVQKRSTAKGSACKKKIQKALNSGYDLKEAIPLYVRERERSNTPLQNFSTFLNNLPDIEALKESLAQPLEQKHQTLAQSPDREDVREFIRTNGIPVDVAKRFWDYYSNRKWHDKNGRPILNWQAKLLDWHTDYQQRTGYIPPEQRPELKRYTPPPPIPEDERPSPEEMAAVRLSITRQVGVKSAC